MTISKTHHIDASDPNAEGQYNYHYAYTTYVFTHNGVEYTARSYDDEPDKVAIVGKSVRAKAQTISAGDLNTPLFTQALHHLKTIEGKQSFWYLDLLNKQTGYTQIAVP